MKNYASQIKESSTDERNRDSLVSIIIPNKDRVELLRKCIHSIQKTTDYKNYEIVLVDNASKQVQTHKFYDTIREKVTILVWNEPFNFSAINNFAARHAKGELLLFMNSDTEVHSREWLTEMLKFSLNSETGAVGCKLLYPNGKIQHLGIIVEPPGITFHQYVGIQNRGQFNLPIVVPAVTAACMMIRKSLFFEVGGFDERFPLDFNDTDFCLKLLKSGKKNICVTSPVIYHLESAYRGVENSPEKIMRWVVAYRLFLSRWKGFMKGNTFFFSQT
ncbi:MAG: glycosyltransferase family 2 protein [Planctomycetes bacterium]|nr:glycosyltransferase family 2 protein [Planctomycetota bacterium]